MKRQADDIGRRGEKVARQLLKRAGYRIVARNYTCHMGEIDIIALDKNELVFVEVKALQSDVEADPEDHVDDRKQRKLRRAAEYYVMAAGAEEIPWPSTIKTVVLGAFLVAVFFVRRPWCTVFCPLGAIYGLCNRVSFFLLRFNSEKCTECENCRSMCQYGGRSEVRIPSAACNRCLAGEKCRAVSVGTVLDRPDG